MCARLSVDGDLEREGGDRCYGEGARGGRRGEGREGGSEGGKEEKREGGREGRREEEEGNDST